MAAPPALPDWSAYCAEIAATPAARPAPEGDAAEAGAHPPVLPDSPPPAALGHGLLARHWQALWAGAVDPATQESPR